MGKKKQISTPEVKKAALDGGAAVMAQNVANVVCGTIGLLARVGSRGVGERQQGRHGHGGAIGRHARGNLREQRGEAEVGYVRGDARRVCDGHRRHVWQ